MTETDPHPIQFEAWPLMGGAGNPACPGPTGLAAALNATARNVEDALAALVGARASGIALLDSADPHPRWGRYRILTANPTAVLTWRGERGCLLRLGRDATPLTGDPWPVVADCLAATVAPSTVDGLPFRGGWIGAFGYDLKNHLERLPAARSDDTGLPDLWLAYYPSALVTDLETNRPRVATTWREAGGADNPVGPGQAGLPAPLGRDEARQHARTLTDALASPRKSWADVSSGVLAAALGDLPNDGGAGSLDSIAARLSNFSRAEYEQAVAQAIEYIRAGDAFQINIAQRFATAFGAGIAGAERRAQPAEVAALSLALRRANPAPFAAMLSLDVVGPTFSSAQGRQECLPHLFEPGRAVVSTSPERFLLIEPDGRAESRPIKGTRPRSPDTALDKRMRAELTASRKDRAELAMIVDLMRNDLSRSCRLGSVEVAADAEVETYATVHHLVATVRGRLREGATVAGALAAAFPAGSVTGAPKIRVMEIIDEIERCARGVYTGAIGYVSAHGRADLNVAIRTVSVGRGRLTFHAGGGITARSDPAAEYDETIAKAASLLRVLGEPAGRLLASEARLV